VSELLSMQFFRNALLMSLLLSGLFGLLSFFIVMRRMAFLGAGVAHAAFGGVALGILLGIDPFLSTVIFCVTVAVVIGKLVRNGRITYDTGIGIFFGFTMALGALFIALGKAYTFDLSGYLFGNILGVTSRDLIWTAAVSVLFIPFVLLFLPRLLFMTFDERTAEVSGVRVGRLDTLLLIFLAVIIVVSIKIVGIVLVSALVVLPASFGLLFSRDYRRVLPVSVAFTAVMMTGGMGLSYALDSPAGATIVVLGTVCYFVAFLIRARPAS